MIANLNNLVVQQIFELPKDTGWNLLSKHLDLADSDLEDDLRAASLVDYYYDVLQFAAERGMPWNEVASCIKFADSYFQPFIDNTLQRSIQLLHKLAVEFVEAGSLSLESAKKVVEFFVSTKLPNQKLYQFAYKNEQENKTFSLDFDVETHSDDLKLKDAQPYAHWKYYQKLEKVKNQEQVNILKLSLKGKDLDETTYQVEKEIDRKIQDKEYENSDVEVDQAKQFLSSLVSDKLELVKKTMEFEVERLKNVTTNAISVKAIPVPQGLNLGDGDVSSSPKRHKSPSAKSPRSPRSPRSGKRSRPTSSRKKRR